MILQSELYVLLILFSKGRLLTNLPILAFLTFLPKIPSLETWRIENEASLNFVQRKTTIFFKNGVRITVLETFQLLKIIKCRKVLCGCVINF